MESINISFQPIEFPDQQEELVNWLCAETWPYHEQDKLNTETAYDITEKYPDESQKFFWVLADTKKIGIVHFYNLENGEGQPTFFDLRLQDTFRGLGLGEMCLQWLTKYLFENYLDLDKVAAVTRSDNTAMKNLFKQNGYVKEGHYRRAWLDDKMILHDTVQYSILRGDWLHKKITPVVWNE